MTRPTRPIFTRALPLLAALLLPCAARATVLANSIPGSVSDGKLTIPYRLFEPELSSPDQKVPLILFLHGAGDRGTDNVGQTYWMSNLQLQTAAGQYAAYVLAPQLPPQHRWDSAGKTPTESEKLTITALADAMQNPNVDPTRIYLTGVSLGSRGAWDILRRHPTTFAAAIPMSYGGDPRTAKIIKDIPIWAFHGSKDPVIPVRTTRTMINALRNAGGNPLYTEVPGGGHEIWPAIYAQPDLYQWLFDQQNLAAAGPLSRARPAFIRATDASPLELPAAAPLPVSIPEPTSGAFIALGAAVLFRRSRRSYLLPILKSPIPLPSPDPAPRI